MIEALLTIIVAIFGIAVVTALALWFANRRNHNGKGWID